jgi:two-component system, NarL family, nitrate/nitrite response regulator NarL
MEEQPHLERIRLALLNDPGLFRESLGHLLSAEPDFEVVGHCSTYSEGLDLLARTEVDMLLLDFTIEARRSEDFINAARQAGYRGRFLIVTAGVDAARSVIALKMGAAGIFLKHNSSRRLVQAIRLIATGEAWIDQSVIDVIAERYPQQKHARLGELSTMEETVLSGLLDGLTNREIGARAGVSESAVKGVVQQLFNKAGVRKRSQLVRLVMEGALGSANDILPGEPKVGHPHVVF